MIYNGKKNYQQCKVGHICAGWPFFSGVAAVHDWQKQEYVW